MYRGSAGDKRKTLLLCREAVLFGLSLINEKAPQFDDKGIGVVLQHLADALHNRTKQRKSRAWVRVREGKRWKWNEMRGK